MIVIVRLIIIDDINLLVFLELLFGGVLFLFLVFLIDCRVIFFSFLSFKNIFLVILFVGNCEN